MNNIEQNRLTHQVNIRRRTTGIPIGGRKGAGREPRSGASSSTTQHGQHVDDPRTSSNRRRKRRLHVAESTRVKRKHATILHGDQ
jgi:hypothetical protein